MNTDANPLEALLSLRPAGKNSTEIERAIAMIGERREGYSQRIRELGLAREHGLLTMTAQQLRALDDEARDFEIAVHQADEFVARLTPQLQDMRRREQFEALAGRYMQFQERCEDFEKRFEPMYREFVEKFLPFVTENNEIRAEFERWKDDTTRFIAREWPESRNGYDRLALREWAEPHGLDIDRDLPAFANGHPGPVCQGYFTRTVLPKPGLDFEDARCTPLAHKGEWWQPKYWGEQRPESTADRLAREEREAMHRRQADRERNERIERARQQLYDTPASTAGTELNVAANMMQAFVTNELGYDAGASPAPISSAGQPRPGAVVDRSDLSQLDPRRHTPARADAGQPKNRAPGGVWNRYETGGRDASSARGSDGWA